MVVSEFESENNMNYWKNNTKRLPRQLARRKSARGCEPSSLKMTLQLFPLFPYRHSVTDGDTTRTYTYHADGQLARAIYAPGHSPASESFEWDGLALVRRNDEHFINEPYVGNAPKKLRFEGKPRAQRSARRARKGPRGNPVASSKGTSYFNDALGTTLGAKKDGKYSPAALSAFGEDISASLNRSPFPVPSSPFFTGKPYVEGLGHTFLMRNYRASLGKWQTADPMGYPDGWNQLAYCNNAATTAVDLWGCARVNHSLTIGGTPSNSDYGGETAYLINIANILESTHTIVLNVDISIAYSSLLYASSAYKSGTVVMYDPHKGAAGGVISQKVREAVEAHETGHANYVIDVIVPTLESRMKMLEVKWFVHGWSEAKVREEIILAISQLNLNVNRNFHEAANDPTVAWFNSSPDWKLVYDAHTEGIWKWVKE